MALKRAVYKRRQALELLAAGVLGDSLGSLGNGVFGQLTWKQKPDSGLNFSRADGASLVVLGQSAGFSGNSFENVVDKAVHDRHGFGADAGVWVDLFQDLVDVDGEAFLSLGLSLLGALDGLDNFFGDGFGFWCHFCGFESSLYLVKYVTGG